MFKLNVSVEVFNGRFPDESTVGTTFSRGFELPFAPSVGLGLSLAEAGLSKPLKSLTWLTEQMQFIGELEPIFTPISIDAPTFEDRCKWLVEAGWTMLYSQDVSGSN